MSSVLLTPLYRWSPVDRRRSIERVGLVPGRRASRPVYDVDGVTGVDWRAPYVCLAPDPVTALQLSWRVFGTPGSEWDLWQVDLADGDEVDVRAEFGPLVQEVRIRNRIPKARVIWLASRTLRDVRGRPR